MLPIHECYTAACTLLWASAQNQMALRCAAHPKKRSTPSNRVQTKNAQTSCCRGKHHTQFNLSLVFFSYKGMSLALMQPVEACAQLTTTTIQNMWHTLCVP